MNLKIYEDQTGLMIYPEVVSKKDEKDAKIVSFFNNSVDLYIEKIGNILTIYCHFIAYKKSARPLGYYVIYNDNYNDDKLSYIKNDIFGLLNSVELQLRYGHVDNIIIENIDKLGLRTNKWSNNIAYIIDALNSFEILEYKGGNIGDILTFYKEILKNSNNVKLTISSVENNLGNINTLINKKFQESLVPNDKTVEILDKYRQRIIENKNIKESEIGKNKIKEGFAIMKDGINAIKSSGADPTEICIEELSKIIDINKIRPKTEIIEKDIEEKKGIGAVSVVLIGIIMLFVGIILGPTVLSHIPAKYADMISPIETQNPIVTPATTNTVPNMTIVNITSTQTANINTTNVTNINMTNTANINTTNVTNINMTNKTRPSNTTLNITNITKPSNTTVNITNITITTP